MLELGEKRHLSSHPETERCRHAGVNRPSRRLP